MSQPEISNIQRDEPSVFLRLVNRYISVWIWSILFGLAVSLSFSLSNVRNIGRYGQAAVIIGSLYVFSSAFVFWSWVSLLKYLRRFIIPLIFSSSELSTVHQHEAYHDLVRSLSSLIIAFVFLIVASFGQAVLEFLFGRL
jgi:hypothetical protein